MSAVAPNIASHQQTVYAEDGIGSTVLGQYGNRRSGDSAAPASEMDSTEVIWLPTATGPMPVAAQINGRLYAIDADHLNTPRRLTNAQGQVVWQWLITGFGEANPTTGATGYAQDGTASGRSYGEQVRFDLRYPGQVWDEETGLSYNLHRYYDAGTGRYVQADPIGLEGGWNRFGYVGADPVNSIDPQGLNAQVFVAGAPILTVGCVVSLGCRQMISNAAQSLADRLSNLIFNRPSKTPNSGDPGSCHVNPGSGQERWYGEDGLPEADRDWDKHHGPNTEVPHGHNWSRDENGRPVRGGSNPYSWALGSKVI